MFKPCNQNRSVGGGFVYDAKEGWSSSTTSGGYHIFTVPEGVRFALLSIRSDSATGALSGASLKVDNIETNSIARYQKEWPSWVEMGEAGPMVEVKDKIEVKWAGANAGIVINGYFFEV